MRRLAGLEIIDLRNAVWPGDIRRVTQPKSR